jgi:hypothetical protein
MSTAASPGRRQYVVEASRCCQCSESLVLNRISGAEWVPCPRVLGQATLCVWFMQTLQLMPVLLGPAI